MTAAGRRRWKAARDTLTIARRELAASFHEPVALVVSVVFLVVQGAWFHAILKSLAQPWRPAPYGAVLHVYFGGTSLYWTFLFFVVSAITMRLVAEERRRGTWETLRTVPVGEGAIVAGKWLGALAFYAWLWLPTLTYPAVLYLFAPPGAGPDPGPIAAAYVGILAGGAAFLAIGLMASAMTSSQLLSGVIALAILLVLGASRELAPWPPIDVRAHMDDLARGVIDSRAIAVYAGIGAVALTAAALLARRGRLRRGAGRRAIAGLLLVGAAAALGNVIAARHPVRIDTTSRRVYSLSDETRAILADVRAPVQAIVLRGGDRRYAEIWDDVVELMQAIAAEQPLVTIEELDLARTPGRAEELSRAWDLRLVEVAEGGAVVFVSRDRSRAVGLLDLAEFGLDATGGGVVTAFRGEEAFASAILDVTDDARPEVCFTTGHGEPTIDETPSGRDLSAIARSLAEDRAAISELPSLATGVPSRCAVVAVVGPIRPLSADAARAVDDFLSRGGRLLVAAESMLDAGGAVAATGLEAVLDAHGARLGPGIAVDPARSAEAMPLGWIARGTYGDHPISAAFQGRRDTIWLEPREVIARDDAPGVTAAVLVSTTDEGWAETDLGSAQRPPRRHDRDRAGPISVAVAAERSATRSRVVVIGSARSLRSDTIDLAANANDAFAASAVAWLTGRGKLVGIGPKTPEQLRLSLTDRQLTRLFWLLVVIVPAAAGAIGAAIRWRRRRP